MDFSQEKLSRVEWESVEKPVTAAENAILNMIIAGYSNTQITINTHTAFITHFKLAPSLPIEQYIYTQYFKPAITHMIKTYASALSDPLIGTTVPRLDSASKIRFANIDKTAFVPESSDNCTAVTFLPTNEDKLNDPKAPKLHENTIYEFLLLTQAMRLCIAEGRDVAYYYYSLHHLSQYSVVNINTYVLEFIRALLKTWDIAALLPIILKNAAYIIEQNPLLLQYGDLTLYSHQQRIFEVFGGGAAPASGSAHLIAKTMPAAGLAPKLVLYMAPTGTGKTLTPLALAKAYRVIYVCAARHVGLALARSAIAVGGKIAFAFGCETSGDIRLHYSAAAEFIRSERTGSIKRVDNSVGHKVEIMICDLKSYVPAMNYMLAHNPAHKIITYWDEPTISLDVTEHPMHAFIRENWSKNRVPNVVLSSATLPTEAELRPIIDDFCQKFDGARVETIQSYDCKKSIPLVDSTGHIVMPHYLCGDERDMLSLIGRHCESHPTLLRYLDLQAVANFIDYVNAATAVDADLLIENTDYFDTIDDITITRIKMYYVQCIQHLVPDKWGDAVAYFSIHRENYYSTAATAVITRNNSTPILGTGTASAAKLITRTQSVGGVASVAPPTDTGMYITTKDAHTLTDGPTIFIAADVRKIAQFCMQQAKIPETVIVGLMEIIEKNNRLTQQIADLEKSVVTATTLTSKKAMKNEKGQISDKAANRAFASEEKDTAKYTSQTRLVNSINDMRARIEIAKLSNDMVPNKTDHLTKWVGADAAAKSTAFTSNIDSTIVSKILAIDGLENYWKILLMMGIGVFMAEGTATYNTQYMEIMKELAADQKLYLIIASSDYIYGTNYQLCHGYLSKDLTATMTQEKIIQALGRIGRNNIQQTYSARFRDDGLFVRLFTPDDNKPEVANMRRLFSTSAEDMADCHLEC